MNFAIEKGSKTAKDGFKNEDFVIQSFNDWRECDLANDDFLFKIKPLIAVIARSA